MKKPTEPYRVNRNAHYKNSCGAFSFAITTIMTRFAKMMKAYNIKQRTNAS